MRRALISRSTGTAPQRSSSSSFRSSPAKPQPQSTQRLKWNTKQACYEHKLTLSSRTSDLPNSTRHNSSKREYRLNNHNNNLTYNFYHDIYSRKFSTIVNKNNSPRISFNHLFSLSQSSAISAPHAPSRSSRTSLLSHQNQRRWFVDKPKEIGRENPNYGTPGYHEGAQMPPLPPGMEEIQAFLNVEEPKLTKEMAQDDPVPKQTSAKKTDEEFEIIEARAISEEEQQRLRFFGEDITEYPIDPAVIAAEEQIKQVEEKARDRDKVHTKLRDERKNIEKEIYYIREKQDFAYETYSNLLRGKLPETKTQPVKEYTKEDIDLTYEEQIQQREKDIKESQALATQSQAAAADTRDLEAKRRAKFEPMLLNRIREQEENEKYVIKPRLEDMIRASDAEFALDHILPADVDTYMQAEEDEDAIMRESGIADAIQFRDPDEVSAEQHWINPTLGDWEIAQKMEDSAAGPPILPGSFYDIARPPLLEKAFLDKADNTPQEILDIIDKREYAKAKLTKKEYKAVTNWLHEVGYLEPDKKSKADVDAVLDQIEAENKSITDMFSRVGKQMEKLASDGKPIHIEDERLLQTKILWDEMNKSRAEKEGTEWRASTDQEFMDAMNEVVTGKTKLEREEEATDARDRMVTQTAEDLFDPEKMALRELEEEATSTTPEFRRGLKAFKEAYEKEKDDIAERVAIAGDLETLEDDVAAPDSIQKLEDDIDALNQELFADGEYKAPSEEEIPKWLRPPTNVLHEAVKKKYRKTPEPIKGKLTHPDRVSFSLRAFFCLPDQGMSEFQSLCYASSFIVAADEKKCGKKFHIVAAAHTAHPWDFKYYFPDSWIQKIPVDAMKYTLGFVENEDGTRFKEFKLSRGLRHPYLDLIVFHLNDENTFIHSLLKHKLRVPALELAAELQPPREGEAVKLIGFDALDLEAGLWEPTEEERNDTILTPTISTGKFNMQSSPHRGFIQTDSPIPNTMIGGPILRNDRKVVGMIESLIGELPSSYDLRRDGREYSDAAFQLGERLVNNTLYIPANAIAEFLSEIESNHRL